MDIVDFRPIDDAFGGVLGDDNESTYITYDSSFNGGHLGVAGGTIPFPSGFPFYDGHTTDAVEWQSDRFCAYVTMSYATVPSGPGGHIELRVDGPNIDGFAVGWVDPSGLSLASYSILFDPTGLVGLHGSLWDHAWGLSEANGPYYFVLDYCYEDDPIWTGGTLEERMLTYTGLRIHDWNTQAPEVLEVPSSIPIARTHVNFPAVTPTGDLLTYVDVVFLDAETGLPSTAALYRTNGPDDVALTSPITFVPGVVDIWCDDPVRFDMVVSGPNGYRNVIRGVDLMPSPENIARSAPGVYNEFTDGPHPGQVLMSDGTSVTWQNLVVVVAHYHEIGNAIAKPAVPDGVSDPLWLLGDAMVRGNFQLDGDIRLAGTGSTCAFFDQTGSTKTTISDDSTGALTSLLSALAAYGLLDIV
jgi:hypothetical protein